MPSDIYYAENYAGVIGLMVNLRIEQLSNYTQAFTFLFYDQTLIVPVIMNGQLCINR